jgi:hypothetical protein
VTGIAAVIDLPRLCAALPLACVTAHCDSDRDNKAGRGRKKVYLEDLEDLKGASAFSFQTHAARVL